MTSALWERICGRYQRSLSAAVYRRRVRMRNSAPLISFTFDDFPASALDVGGRILREHGASGTYYVSLGLLDRDEPVGRICSAGQLGEAVAQGHELGCHTFQHCDAWSTAPSVFERSIVENCDALRRILPETAFRTMSYPIGSPRPATKRRVSRYFAGCRGGGQRINAGTMDLNQLRAFFLEQSSERPAVIWEVIERNRSEGGWLIFVTHDVTRHPSRFGCTRELFEEVVRRSVRSEARILPVAVALTEAAGLSSDLVGTHVGKLRAL
jgi:peptidoglycan/xylan/chitin deacetylase (PgdA/CDA1 family)